MAAVVRPAPRARLISRVVLLLLAATTQGCVKTPSLTPVGTELSGATSQGLAMNVLMAINNPNGHDIQLRSVRATTTLTGLRQPHALAPIDYPMDRWLPAEQTTTLRIPILIPWPTVMSLALETPFTSQVTYRVQGKADVTASSSFRFDRDDMPFDAQGVLSRQALISFAQRAPLAR